MIFAMMLCEKQVLYFSIDIAQEKNRSFNHLPQVAKKHECKMKRSCYDVEYIVMTRTKKENLNDK